MLRFALAILVAIATVTMGPSAPSATAAVGNYTVVIGDSLTVRAKPNLLAYRPTWDIDGVGGRRVTELPARINAAVTRHGGKHPETIVVALGTNYHSTWEGSDYNKVRQMLPQTRIVFVTPFRDPRVAWNPGWSSDRTAARYAYFMTRIANADRRACIVPWAFAAANNPDAYLIDGVHGTEYGQERWAWEVAAGASACQSTEP